MSFQVYDAEGDQVPHLHSSDGPASPATQILRQELRQQMHSMERSERKRVPGSNGQLGGQLRHRGRLFHHILHVPGDIRALIAMRVSSHFEPALIQSP